jgi:hypothetical protein
VWAGATGVLTAQAAAAICVMPLAPEDKQQRLETFVSNSMKLSCLYALHAINTLPQSPCQGNPHRHTLQYCCGLVIYATDKFFVVFLFFIVTLRTSAVSSPAGAKQP